MGVQITVFGLSAPLGEEAWTAWNFESLCKDAALLADPSSGFGRTSLDALGIRSLSWSSLIVNATDAQGNTRARTATYTQADGTTRELAEYRFARDATGSIPADAPIVSGEIDSGHDRLKDGSGMLYTVFFGDGPRRDNVVFRQKSWNTLEPRILATGETLHCGRQAPRRSGHRATRTVRGSRTDRAGVSRHQFESPERLVLTS